MLDRRGVKIEAFIDNKRGDKWCKLFKSRHRQLTQRLAENVKPARAKVSPGALQGFMTTWKIP